MTAPVLTRSRIVRAVYDQNPGLTHDRAGACVDHALNILTEALSEGDNVLISGFGRFRVRAKNPRRGRNPHTRQPIEIEARRVVTFKPSEGLKARMNREGETWG